jgi:hypothetical protein
MGALFPFKDARQVSMLSFSPIRKKKPQTSLYELPFNIYSWYLSENYERALELTSIPKIKIDPLLAKGTLLPSFLDAPEDARKFTGSYTRTIPSCGDCPVQGGASALPVKSPGLGQEVP